MGRAPCCDKKGLKKGPWTQEEDQKLINYIQKNGSGNWRSLPKKADLERCGKSCRLRWTNYLRPDIKRGRFSFEEEETIIQLHSILGNKWSAIAARLPKRTDNEIKNYWNTHIRKKLLRMGIDPVTHSPRLDLLDLSSILNSPLYNSSQLNNLSKLLGVQSLVNPELLKLATSHLSSSSSHAQNNSSVLLQNLQQNQTFNPQNQNEFPPLIQPNQIQEIPTTCVSLPNEEQQPDVDQQFLPVLGNLSSSENFQVNEWQTNGMIPSSTVTADDYLPLQKYSNIYESYQPVMYPLSSENSTFQSNNGSNFSFQSVLSNLSTPSSSPTPLNSNSTTYVSSGGYPEDERESYCSNLMKFEIPDIFDVNAFM